MTQIEVSFRDTSRPTYWLLLDMVPLHWRCRDQNVTSPAITPCPDLRTMSAVARSGGQGWPVSNDETAGIDRFVSLEVLPHLAYNTVASINAVGRTVEKPGNIHLMLG